jgi:hypothetical protein
MPCLSNREDDLVKLNGKVPKLVKYILVLCPNQYRNVYN